MVSGSRAVALDEPQLHVVVLADLRIAEARDFLIAADHQPQRRRDVLRLDAEVGGAGAIDAARAAPACSA